MDTWAEAFRAEGVDPEPYAHADWDPGARLPWDVVDSLMNKKWLSIELDRALKEGTLSVCGPADCHGCAPFARDCVKGLLVDTTGRPLVRELPVLSTPAAPGPGTAAEATEAPELPAERPSEEASAEVTPRYRYRARFSKVGRIRFLGHLDLMRGLLRALRRSRVALIYSQGFNPKPKVALGPALSVGIASEGEYLDLETSRRLDPESDIARINDTLPDGLGFIALREIDRGEPAISEAVRAARYRLRVPAGSESGRLVDAFKARGEVSISRERKGKVRTFRLDREILELEAETDELIRFALALRQQGGSVSPGEAVREILGDDTLGAEIVREDLLVECGGKLVNPLLAAATAAADVERAVC
jgi:radical SAM-linked protein